MSEERIVTGKSNEIVQFFLHEGSIAHHLVGDASQLGDFEGDKPAGVDQRLPGVDHPLTIEFDGANFDDRIFLGSRPVVSMSMATRGDMRGIIPSGG